MGAKLQPPSSKPQGPEVFNLAGCRFLLRVEGSDSNKNITADPRLETLNLRG